MAASAKPKKPRIPLEDAITQFGLPLANRDFVRDLAAHVGISACEVTPGFIKAFRADRGSPLRIAAGHTTGFVSREEAKAAAGEGADTWESDRASLWGVTHPVTYTSRNSARAEAPERDHGTCPVHFVALPATGVCDLCD